MTCKDEKTPLRKESVLLKKLPGVLAKKKYSKYRLGFIIGPMGNLPSFHDLGHRLYPAVGCLCSDRWLKAAGVFYRRKHIFALQMLHKSAHLPLSNFHGCGRASRRVMELRTGCGKLLAHRWCS
jgi:hypothetical protein